ncbi:hypothetical protein F4774DRAFT_425125 [Daldinia eschscholtzii]|nr:hypothetical protein F4774DRAFT_425125 [Daldinia eschscholtzii]
MSSVMSGVTIVWSATDELSPSDKEREEFAYNQLLKDRPTFTRENWERLLKLVHRPVLQFLFELKKEPPCVGNSYVHYLVCLNAFRKAMRKEEWAFYEEQPETHAEPFSLAYIGYWYDQTYKEECTKVLDDAEQQVSDDGEMDEAKARVVPGDIEPTDLAPLVPLWNLILAGEKVDEGEEPFEIIIPASRDITKVLSSPEKLERFLADLSEELCGLDGLVFCRVGDILRPTTLFMRPCTGVDIASPGVQWRFVRAWDTLCMAAERAVKEDINILDLVRDAYTKTLVYPVQSFSSRGRYRNALKEANEADEETRREIHQAKQESERNALLCAAHHREMTRLADEVLAKLLEGDITFEEKARSLADFVEKGDPAIPINRPSARARAAELGSLRLGADLIREAVQPESSLSAAEKNELVEKFIISGDDRLPHLTNVYTRLLVAEDVWLPLAEAKSRNALKNCRVTLGRIRGKVESLFRTPSEEEEEEEDEEGYDEDQRVSDSETAEVVYSDEESREPAADFGNASIPGAASAPGSSEFW